MRVSMVEFMVFKIAVGQNKRIFRVYTILKFFKTYLQTMYFVDI